MQAKTHLIEIQIDISSGHGIIFPKNGNGHKNGK